MNRAPQLDPVAVRSLGAGHFLSMEERALWMDGREDPAPPSVPACRARGEAAGDRGAECAQ